MVANPFAGGNTTYANPLVKPTGAEIVPLLVSLPVNPECPKPYPVMIFQHGITADRTNMLGIADTMASVCTAVIAMDLPLHGITAGNPVNQALQAFFGTSIFTDYTPGAVRERTFGVDFVDNETGAPGPDGLADSSGAYTMNLRNILVARDNNRQSCPLNYHWCWLKQPPKPYPSERDKYYPLCRTRSVP